MINNLQSTDLSQEELRDITVHYDSQSEEEAIAEAEAASRDPDYIWLQVPRQLSHEIELMIQHFEDARIEKVAVKKKSRRSA